MGYRKFTTDELFELLLLGMMWRAEERVLLQQCSGIYQTLVFARVLTAAQREALARDYKLLTKIANEATQVKVGRTNLAAAQREVGDVKKPLVVLLNYREMFLHGMLLGSRVDYKLFITPSGTQQAKAFEARYKDIVTREQFFAAWDVYVSTNSATHVRLRRGW